MHDFLPLAINAVEAVGVVILLGGLLLATARFAYGSIRGQMNEVYVPYRRDLGRVLLLSLEFLVAADLLETLLIEMTLESLGILAGLIIVRTILQFALEFEMSSLKRD
jgi:uncharacterized membrane protein